ncbi:thiamine phosphate synthase [Chitinophaga sp. 22321]|uniref:Thiamine-phosphate synthase n=1 Tax=Chitinophaga hostae TaxID=2831022 RepID=A0ABS5ISQ0_9BACT|nr:thiamine phosphate synthase [Chitinophaga hostae]MBS0025983.1 thiamine phosphate synthase [Chitinophaga hostae]
MISTLHYISQPHHTDNILAACDAGCKWIQLRIKNEPAETILPVAEAVKKICDRYQASLIINDHPQIAVAVGAAGVHVGKLDMSVAEARVITGPEMIVGGTANTLEDILQHVADGASYVGVGPFRFTTTKQNLSPILGLSGYQSIIQALQKKNIAIPVIAIGGILLEDIPALLAAGVYGVAVSGLITHAANRQTVVHHIHQQLNQTPTWNL